MPLPKFVALSAIGATLWSTAVVGTGMLFADEIGVLLARLPALG
jgi:membrane protein DedA with SNARE-associated domain